MSVSARNGWDPGAYHRFRDLRLRPALDLLARVPELPDGRIVDLGAGSGQAGPALLERFPGRQLSAVDASSVMLEEAERAGVYDRLVLQDIADWSPEADPALIFSNAALHWLSDHATLFPRLAALPCPGGVLAVQMPRQFDAPSHRLLRDTARTLFPDRFDLSCYRPPVAAPPVYAELLAGFGRLDLWESETYQTLAPAEGAHPVRLFTASTAARPIVERLSPPERETFFQAYDAALAEAYPAEADGSVTFPFRRLFMVLQRDN